MKRGEKMVAIQSFIVQSAKCYPALLLRSKRSMLMLFFKLCNFFFLFVLIHLKEKKEKKKAHAFLTVMGQNFHKPSIIVPLVFIIGLQKKAGEKKDKLN